MALGASASNVLTMTLRQGMTLAVVGVVAAAALARVLQALLYGVSSIDPLALRPSRFAVARGGPRGEPHPGVAGLTREPDGGATLRVIS
jgi:hypothetical protein